jgi:uncharacterized protein (TIGR02217 family)
MAFHDIRFPDEISYGASGGPEFQTSIVMVKSGQESRNQNWSQSRIKWDVSTAVRNRTDLNELIAFFRLREGKAHGFRFKDWTDFTGTQQNIGTGNGTLTTFQLSKTYNDGLITKVRTITKPVSGTVRIYLNGVEQFSGFSVGVTTGIVTFTVAPAAGVVVTATYEFDIPARFDTDQLKVNIQGYEAFIGDAINIVEIRE